MLVYDITNSESFINIEKWIKKDEGAEEVVKMIIGNKCDMEESRIISLDKVEKLSNDHKIPYMEISDKSCHKIKKAFFDMVEKIISKKKECTTNNLKLQEPVNKNNLSKLFQFSCILL